MPYRDEFYLFWEFGAMGCGDCPFRSLTRGATLIVYLPNGALKESLACGMTISLDLYDTKGCGYAICDGNGGLREGFWDFRGFESFYRVKVVE